MKQVIETLEKFMLTREDKDKRAFHKALYNCYFEKIFLYVRRRNRSYAEDLTHDTFVKLFKVDPIHFYDKIDRLEAYIILTARNVCIDSYKKKPSGPTVKLIENIDSIYVLINSIKTWEDKIYLEQILASLDGNHRQRKAIELYAEGYKYAEIAEKMDTSMASVKNLILRGRRDLNNRFR